MQEPDILPRLGFVLGGGLVVSNLAFEFQVHWVVVKTMVPSLGTLNIRCRIILRTQKETIIFDNHSDVVASLFRWDSR